MVELIYCDYNLEGMSGMIHYIEGSQLTAEVLKSQKIIIAEFCIENSMPCDIQFNILKELEKEYTDLADFFKIDVTSSQETKILYDIFSFPTLIFFQNNTELERHTGVMEKEKIAAIIKNGI